MRHANAIARAAHVGHDASGHIGHQRLASGGLNAAQGKVKGKAFRIDAAPFSRCSAMPICHEHNLARPLPRNCSFGIRVRLRSTDPFKNLVGDEWTRQHWFPTRDERDRALKEMSGRYVYFRPGDQPSLEFEKIER
jgi:hypothetical protein